MPLLYATRMRDSGQIFTREQFIAEVVSLCGYTFWLTFYFHPRAVPLKRGNVRSGSSNMLEFLDLEGKNFQKICLPRLNKIFFGGEKTNRRNYFFVKKANMGLSPPKCTFFSNSLNSVALFFCGSSDPPVVFTKLHRMAVDKFVSPNRRGAQTMKNIAKRVKNETSKKIPL